MKTLISAGTALVVLVFGTVGTATAAGTLSCKYRYPHRAHPGTQCIVSSGSSPGYTLGRLSNVGTSPITVQCPAGMESDALGVATKMWVIAQHPAEAVTCNARLVASTKAGISGAVVRASSKGTSALPQALTFPQAKLTRESAYESMHVECTLPTPSNGKRSAVVGYQTFQPDCGLSR